MAGKITHLEVFNQAVKHLDHGTTEQRKIAKLLLDEKYKNYAYFGSIAPDIFYYYHLLAPKRTKKSELWGNVHHHDRVCELILNFLDLILETDEGDQRNKLIAFTLGYICHCAVDITTHPYIFYISGDYYNKDPKVAREAQLNHMRVEFALDSYILDHRWGMSPKEYDFTHYIDIRVRGKNGLKKIDSVIWVFWTEALRLTFPEEFQKYYIGSEKKIIPGDILNESYLGYIRFNQVLDSRSSFVRGFLKVFDKITFNSYQASVLMMPVKETIDKRIMNQEEKEWYYPADKSIVKKDSFISLANTAALNSRIAMNYAWDYLNDKTKRDTIIKEYQGYNLDTGLRNQNVTDMKEFQPIK